MVTGDLRATLPATLAALQPSSVAVVACHACSHLTDEILHACAVAGVDFAVMPYVTFSQIPAQARAGHCG